MRSLNKNEKSLVACLLKGTSISNFDLDSIKVNEMSDGGMGSLYFIRVGKSKDERQFGKCISERQFLDSDKIPILVSLNLDQDEELYELDIWKADFSQLINFPICN